MSTPILEATGIVKQYGKFMALGGVDLRVMPGTVHSVIGPNGAGKTTLFHMLTGTRPVSAGRIVFEGKDVTAEADYQRVQRGIARSFQVTSLFPNLSVRENLRLAALAPRPARR
jgi:branched-chain amino acid transport system ATP-binding protein